MAHITGGGLVENIPRMMPNNCQAIINKDSWPKPPIFELLRKAGNIDEEEMYVITSYSIHYTKLYDQGAS